MPSLCKSHQSTDTRQPLFERVGTSQSQIHTGYRKAISIGSRVAGLLGPEYSWHTRDPQNYDIQAWQIRDDSSNHLDTWTHSLHPSIGSESDSHGSTMFIHVLPISTLLPSPSQLLCPLLLSSTHQTDKLLSHWHLTEISVAHISLEPMSRNLSPTLHTLHQSLHSWTAFDVQPRALKNKTPHRLVIEEAIYTSQRGQHTATVTNWHRSFFPTSVDQWCNMIPTWCTDVHTLTIGNQRESRPA